MDKLSTFLNGVAQWITIVAVAIMSLIVIIEVFNRNVLGFSYSWSEELTRYLLVWVTFIGGSVAFKNFQLVGFDMVVKVFKGKTREIIKLISQVIILIFLSIILYLGIKQSFAPAVLNQITPGLGIKMMWAYIAIPIGCFFMIIHSLPLLFMTIKKIIDK